MSEIRMDLSGMMTSRALHAALAAALCFPSYYGHNWNAFDDCAGDPEQRSDPL